jgi:acetyl esterase/lipase
MESVPETGRPFPYLPAPMALVRVGQGLAERSGYSKPGSSKHLSAAFGSVHTPIPANAIPLSPYNTHFAVVGGASGWRRTRRTELNLFGKSAKTWKFAVSGIFILCSLFAMGQQTPTDRWTETASFDYGITSDITYGVFQNVPVHLDVWRNLKATGPVPTLMYVHGGGWVMGNKDGAVNLFLPYVERGWNVVNVEYRMAGTSLAPAAVEDVRCALRWMYRNSAQYHFDITRIVVTGHSAGGHLALMAGMVPAGSDLDSECPADSSEPPLKVAAIVNWFGITDVNDLLAGPDRKTYAVAWIGAQPDKEELARHVSPLTYVRPGLPPIITIHGDHDPTVPYSQAVRLRDALQKAGVPNELVTVPNGGHGSFSDDQTREAFSRIWPFLKAHHLQGPADVDSSEVH